MFRITRGMHVQHIQFPYPVLGPRDLDADDAEAPADADTPAATPAVEPEDAGDETAG